MKSPGQWDGAAVNSLVSGSKASNGLYSRDIPPGFVRGVQYCLVKFNWCILIFPDSRGPHTWVMDSTQGDPGSRAARPGQ